MNTSGRWWELRSFFPRSRSSFAIIIALSVINAALLIPVPLLAQYIIDDAVPSERLSRIVIAGTLLILLLVISELLILLRRKVTAQRGKDGIEELRRAAVQQLHQLPIQYHRASDPVRLHDRIVSQITKVDLMLQSVFNTVLPTAILVAAIAGVMLSINRIVFVEALVALPLIYGIYRYFQPRVRHREDTYDQTVNEFSDSIMYSLRSMELTRSRGAEAMDLARNQSAIAAVKAADVDARRVRGVYRTLERSALAVFAALVLVTLGIESARGIITTGEVFAFLTALGLLILPTTLTLAAVPVTSDGLVALNDVMGFLAEPAARPYSGTTEISNAAEVSLEQVTFSYGDETLLTDISLQLEPGTVTMIAGPNGSGKSSIVSLILGFFRPDQGMASVGGIPYGEVDIQSLRQRLGYVAQEPTIVAGTIADNIKYGSPDASDVDMWQAAHLATVDDFIVDFPDGYEHPLGFGGRTLSAGQRQRIAIARALGRQPDLLILDEPTSYLDAGTLRRVIANVARQAEPPTVLITSHLPRVIDTVDRLYHIEGRRLIPDVSSGELEGQTQ